MMAIKIKSFKFKPIGRPCIYCWDKWCDGSIWKAVREVDYKCISACFQNSLRNKAKKTNKKVRAMVTPDYVVFQFYEISTNKKKSKNTR